jgi:4-amino-4-deoxy-L-arabinose transferase-like glycosyltransferase
MLSGFYKKYSFDVLNIFLISLVSPLFFYKLGQTTLGSWDEAWYGEIARNILKSGNIFNLWWNGAPYTDHPPAGFWIIAIFESTFGFNEFGVRIGSAIFALIGLYVVYLLGRELFSKTVGLVSAISLSSAYWYLFRARSGNLDIFLTFFFILTFYLAVKSSKNKKFLIPFFLSFALLILTKSLIPLTIIPALLIIFYKSKLNLRDFLKPILAFALIIIPWILALIINTPSAFMRYLVIGAPGVDQHTDYLTNFKLVKEYLHLGIGKWFWPGVLGIIIGPLTRNKYLIALSVFCLSFFLPFVLSNKGHIWHLIPLYPFLILSFYGFLQIFLETFNKRFLKVSLFKIQIILLAITLPFCLYFSYLQIKRSWYEFIDIEPFISDEEILSVKAGEYPYDLYIDGGDFRPTAVFYSGKDVRLLAEPSLLPLFESNKKFIMITNPDRLELYKIPDTDYDLIASDRDRILIIRK